MSRLVGMTWEQCVEQLQKSERGRDTLARLRELFNGPACSLDSQNMEALTTLTVRFAYGERGELE